MQSPTIVEGFRLSPQQRRLWKLQQDAVNDARFTAQLVLLLEGEVRADALREALERVCRRHQALRSTFRRLPGVALPVQSVADHVAVSWTVSEAPRSREELLERETRRLFDYENRPLVHATLFAVSPKHHLLSVCMPALCADRRTLSNLFLEVSRGYAEAGRETDDEPFQYIQFSEWQNSLWEEDDAEKGREYWSRQELADASFLLPGQPHHANTRGELHSFRFSLSPEQQSRVIAVANKYSTTSATVLLAAWQTLLWRLTERSIVIGNINEGRSYELLHDAFGLFARVLPVCCQLTTDLRFNEVVAQIDGFQREADEWQDYFDLEQMPAAPNYFSFGFEYAELPPTQTKDKLQVSIYRQRCYLEPFDLKLSVLSSGGLSLDYDNAAFDHDYIQHLAEQFETLLEAALANPESPVAELEIVSAAQRQRLLFDWNNTNCDYQLDQCFHQLFEQQVERTPDTLAVVFQDQQLTFAELNRRANQLAHYLQAQGVGPETPVGICLEPSVEMVTAVLGILKAGGAYLPLDPRNPRPRIEQILTDAGTSILLTRDDLAKATLEKTHNPQSQTGTYNLAYIIYTSGSTGKPKGVMIQHRSVINLAAALREEPYAGLGPQLKVGLSAPLAFDASVKQLVQLLHGHTLHVLSEDLRLDAAGALAYLDRHALDVLDCTPSQLDLLLAAGLDKAGREVPKLMLVGGEALAESTWSRLSEDRRTRFYNVYGPTECTVDATWAPVSNTSPTIGRPIPNTQVYILDQNLKPVGINLTGELYITGAGLARGYLDSRERTAERFIPDGLSGQEGARLYRTGDLARYAPDGSIVFNGRNDAQVKVRGHRIELGEIEAALREHENVRLAVVAPRENEKAGVRLVAYVVAHDGVALDASELRRRLSERLPDYMLPSSIVALDELPLTRNGKVDLNALPAPEAVRPSRDEHYLAPRNEIEEKITAVWQDVLGLNRIGVNDNFFDAGGHSLLMVQVHSKLSEMFQKQISIVEMFAKPTIGALAEYFSETNGHKPTFEKVMDRAARRRHAVSMRQ